MSTEIEVKNCFVNTLLRMKNFATYTFVVKDMFNLQSKDFSQILATAIKIS